MTRFLRIAVGLVVVAATGPGLAQTTGQPRHDLPQPYATTRTWGELPPGVKWAAVTAIEPAPDGTIYVVHRCFENSCAGRPEAPILKYNANGKLLASFGQGLMIFPHGGTVDRQGNLWMTDAGSAPGKGHQAFKFSPDGKILMTLGKAGVSGSGPSLFDQPTDVVVAPNGDLFITDSHRNGKNNRVMHFTEDGKFVKEWGRKGSGRGELSEPHTMAMDSRGRLFVGDRENNRIVIYDQKGQVLDEWRQFGRPSGIVITRDDTMYVADSESWGTDTGARELPGIKKGIRIGSTKDGRVTAFIEDQESTAADHAGAEGLGVDAAGNVYGGVVRRRMLERHVLTANPLASPESVGFSADGLKAYQQAMRALVDDGKLAGVTTLVARHGKVVQFDAYGVQNLDTKKPVTKDTIFRIASMTKPIAGVAMMMLWEQGKWTLDDPVAKHIPQFANLKVTTPNGEVAQTRPMTMRQLMSHSAGFDVSAGYTKANLREANLQAMIDKLAKLPLAAQPGTDWRYGPSVDIQGYLVEKLSGQTLDVFLRTKIFEPLGMTDTGFWVAPSKADRVTKMFTYGPDKRLMTAPTQGDPTVKPAFLSGGGGLLSTMDDYRRFAQMLLNGGEANGKRLLKASTVELMRTNVLADGVTVDLYGPNVNIGGIGFGLDFAVILDPAKANTPEGKNSFYWGGAFGTWFWIDPANDLIAVGMMQNLAGSSPAGGSPQVRPLSRKLVYQALVEPKK